MENFHEIAEERKETRKAVKELGIDPKSPENLASVDPSKKKIFDKHYKDELGDLDEKASKFKIADFKTDNRGALSGAKEALKAQKSVYEQESSDSARGLDLEAIESVTPEIAGARKAMAEIADLKDFRMKRMFEILNPKISVSRKKLVEPILETINDEIKVNEETLAETDPLIVRQAELVKYKEDLSKSGHICITPSVEADLDAIGDRMLTGKPMFLHGPTGTGKTSLARYAARHFSGQDPEMVFCNPQTKESNVWGKTGIRPAKGGAIETVEIYGPLAKAMNEGKTVVFDEFTALPKEQMVFIKGIFNAKPGDKVNIVGNGIVEITPGFQMVFTANLKSEKNPERQELPPEIAREFEQNNVKVSYTPKEEAYDIILSRLLNSDGSLDMSFHDLNHTLPKLCEAMKEIQESYTGETNKDVAKKAGAMDASGKFHSLKKFVMTQGTVENILSAWQIEKKTKKADRSFVEFLDQRLKTALTFEEYSKEDRILAAKVLASMGFLTTLTAEDLGLPADIFAMNTMKTMRGEDAVEELTSLSSDVKHLSLKEVSELDPFGLRAEILKGRAEALLHEPEKKTDDDFSKSLRGKLGKLIGRKTNKHENLAESVVSAEYTYTNPKTNKVERQETIEIDIEKKLDEFTTFYAKTGVDLPPDFSETITDIWSRNQESITEAIENHGFDDILILPPNIPLPDLAEKMKMGNRYFEWDNFKEGGSFAGAKSPNVDKPRIMLVHKSQNLKDRPELASTLNTLGSKVKLDEALPLEDYLVFSRKYFEETQKHLDEIGWTWTSTKSGSRLVCAHWYPDGGKLGVGAGDLAHRYTDLGVRPSHSFY